MRNDHARLLSGTSRAVVVGAGMAGLLAAAVLSRHVDQVVVLERDQLADPPEPRRGVPQGRHSHGLLTGGLDALDRLLPGYRSDLAAAGAAEICAGEMPIRNPRGWIVPLPGEFVGLSGTRGLIEHVTRLRVAALDGVELRSGAAVVGLHHQDGVVRGVRVRDEDDVLLADLVVDASGRTSRAHRWLAGLGAAVPDETVIDPHLVYASVSFTAPTEAVGNPYGILLQLPVGAPARGAVVTRVENGRWMATLYGAGEANTPPRDLAGLQQFADSLVDPVFGGVLRAATDVSEIALFGATANRRRHYERLREHVPGFVVMGDAVCSFNPLYAQGMSVAAYCAEELGHVLLGGGSARELYQRTHRAAQGAWMLAAGTDLRRPETDGKRPVAAAVVNRYLLALSGTACWDVEVRREATRVANLLAPASRLFAPTTVLAVLRASATGQTRRPSPRPTALPAPLPVQAASPAAETLTRDAPSDHVLDGDVDGST